MCETQCLSLTHGGPWDGCLQIGPTDGLTSAFTAAGNLTLTTVPVVENMAGMVRWLNGGTWTRTTLSGQSNM